MTSHNFLQLESLPENQRTSRRHNVNSMSSISSFYQGHHERIESYNSFYQGHHERMESYNSDL